ncbi:MAG: monovalent cation/H(+) antiporter subunit G [Candidatus Omnitrophica bacterium]|nr:monovalent cation/H(+) antiporter subunit G [Candidatus Omnitrophota bacterium]MCM8791152.1 monovalent cation/H(+) antiporter subunit G [Candidatus Omnitrophota bacterium]
MNETIGTALIVIGLIFDFFGCLGLIRFPDVYNRLQASAKCITLGTCGILLGLFLFKGLTATGVKALLCMVFILLTAPVSAHALARSAYRSGVKPWEGTVVDEYSNDMENIR